MSTQPPYQPHTAKQQKSATQRSELIAQACRLIQDSASMPSLEQLALQAKLSPAYFHKLFKSETGLTPKAYGDAQRAARLRNKLKNANSITEAIYEADYNTSSRFYETAETRLGMLPNVFREGGHKMQIHFAVGQCELGAILVAQSQRGICAIFLGDDPDALIDELHNRFPKAELLAGDHQFEQLVAQVVGFVQAPNLGLNLPLDIQGTAFQERVWQVLRDIPPGETLNYTEVAQRVGSPKAVRAVAGACAANLLAVAIPCHRVIRLDGGLSGYRWGVERKRELLRRENKTPKPKIL